MYTPSKPNLNYTVQQFNMHTYTKYSIISNLRERNKYVTNFLKISLPSVTPNRKLNSVFLTY